MVARLLTDVTDRERGAMLLLIRMEKCVMTVRANYWCLPLNIVWNAFTTVGRCD